MKASRKDNNILFSVLLFSVLLFACSQNNVNTEYEKIKNSDLTGFELFSEIYNFDSKYPDFIESKLDLGSYYLLQFNPQESYKYLVQAEALINAGSHAEKEQQALLYNYIAIVYLLENNTEKAWNYAQKAYSVPDAGKSYGYLCGRILALINNEKEALKYFNEAYSAFPEKLDKDAARTYMLLLAKSSDYKKCASILDKVSEDGIYFPDFGIFASKVYESTGEYRKAVLYAWLDYEYKSDYGYADNEKFLQNLKNFELKFPDISQEKDVHDALTQLRSLYSNSSIPAAAGSDYISQYIQLKEKKTGRYVFF